MSREKDTSAETQEEAQVAAARKAEGKEAPQPPAGKAAKDDDRNLVLVDKDFAEADFEDKVWLFWERYRGWVLATVVALFLAVVVVQGWAVYQEQSLEGLQEDYQAAESAEAKVEFGRAHAGKALAGAALLEAAHEAYEAGEFETAATRYDEAAESLRETQLFGVARLGYAMSVLNGGDTEAGTQLLREVFENRALLGAVRREAGYHLAYLLMGQDEYVEARSTLLGIEGIGVVGGTPWKQRAQQVLQSNPKLFSAEAAERATREAASKKAGTSTQDAPGPGSEPSAEEAPMGPPPPTPGNGE